MTMKVPTASYKYIVAECKTAKQLGKLIDKNRHREGFYIYKTIPQPEGCIVICAVADKAAIKERMTPKVDASLKPLSEEQAKQLLTKCEYVRPEHTTIVDNFIVWLYENSYRILREVKE